VVARAAVAAESSTSERARRSRFMGTEHKPVS
jgi:hypothetical protein